MASMIDVVFRRPGAFARYLNRIRANYSAEMTDTVGAAKIIAEKLKERIGEATPRYASGVREAVDRFLSSSQDEVAAREFLEQIRRIEREDLRQHGLATLPRLKRMGPRGLFDVGRSMSISRAAALAGVGGNKAIARAHRMLGTGTMGQVAGGLADFYFGYGWETGIKRGLATYMAYDATRRLMGGGGLFHDRDGNFDIVGVPLI